MIWKHVRAFFWFIQVSPLHMWWYLLRFGPRIQVFRNRRYKKGFKNIRGEDIGGERMYTHYRWGVQVLGFSIGDRGGTREYMRKKLGLSPRWKARWLNDAETKRLNHSGVAGFARDASGAWWFWDETGASTCGPYPTHGEAEKGLWAYIQEL